MNKFLLLMPGLVFGFTLIAQENSRNKSRNQETANQKKAGQTVKEKKVTAEHSKKVWEGTSDTSLNVPVPAKSQPAMVSVTFQRDYPNATNVSWSKYRGDWVATFGNGIFMSTALYHANGERRDTRTPITKKEVPPNIFDSIFNRRRNTWLEDIIKIETPGTGNNIFRIKDIVQGKPVYFYYNIDGKLVGYNY